MIERKSRMNEYQTLFNQSQTYFKSQETKSIKFRKKQLKLLAKTIKQHQAELIDALNQDLGKSDVEAYATEIGFVLHSIKQARQKVSKWAKKKAVDTPFFLFPAKSFMIKEPLGTVLIVGPFNYPFQLIFEPLIGAITAGNTAILKPSELTPHVSDVIEKMIHNTFPSHYISVVQGDAEVLQSLLALPFDHIFFTGSQRVGQIVYEAASKHLTPVTLELGGKSPTIIDKTANLKVASERICFGKFLNAGQTCVAPDYILIDESVREDFIKSLQNTIIEFYGKNPQMSEDLGRIVNTKHFKRLENLLLNHKSQIVHGGQTDPQTRYIAPTIIDCVKSTDLIMQDEIFGPLLPIMSYQQLDEAIDYIHSQPKPLSLYLFSEDENVSNRVINELSFGSGAINDTILQLANPHLPFGGVGQSGIGRYHGRYSFDTFTHEKPYIFKTTKLESALLFPPYKGKLKYIKQIFKH